MKHEKFTYKSLDDVKAKCKELGVTIPFADNTECLSAPIRIGNREIPNRLGIAPMEGADSTPDGKPSEYTEKRYTREAAGGAGIIWYEAISIVEEGRSSRTQLLLTRETLDSFKRLNEKVKEAGLKANGFEPFLVMQSNHSGRYSNPDNRPAPLIAQRNAWLETFRAADDSCIVSDDYLKHIEEKTGESALLAREAGYKVEQDDVEKNLFIPSSYFSGSVENFWEKLPMLDAEFEERRKKLEADGKHWRFVAKLENGHASVGLQEVGADHPFYTLEGSNNIILLTTERYREYPMMIQGYGAGASVTAAGVFADIMSIANV